MEAQPRERHLNRTLGHLTPYTSIKEALFSPTNLHPIRFSSFWKHDIHLHSSLPTTTWIKEGENRTHEPRDGWEKNDRKAVFKRKGGKK